MTPVMANVTLSNKEKPPSFRPLVEIRHRLYPHGVNSPLTFFFLTARLSHVTTIEYRLNAIFCAMSYGLVWH